MKPHQAVEICLIFALIVLGTLFIHFLFVEQANKNACGVLGMEYKHNNDGSFNFCISNDGQAHYVKFDCNGILWAKQCTAQLISIGDNRVVIQ